MDATTQGVIEYNPATGCFEATIRLTTAHSVRTYACELEGPLSADLGEVELEMHRQARMRDVDQPGLYSYIRHCAPQPRQAPRQPLWREILDRASSSLKFAA